MDILGLSTLAFLHAAMPGSATDPTTVGPCAPHDVIAAQLEEKYKEVSLGGGLSKSGYIVEIFASPSGSWTAVITVPNQPSCLMDAGEGWQTRVPPVLGDGI